MKQHEWMSYAFNSLHVCAFCGLNRTPNNQETSCPPWIEAKQSDTSDSSALEVIRNHVREAKKNLTVSYYPVTFGHLEIADRLLTELIEEDSK